MIRKGVPALLSVRSILSKHNNNVRLLFDAASKSGHESEKTQLSEHKQTGVSETTRPSYNSPFLKNIFAGIYDPEVLIYPESLSKLELKNLENSVLKAQNLFTKKDDKLSMEEPTSMNQLKDSGLVGSSLSQEYGGEDLKATQVLRLYEEISDENVASLLYAHNSLGIKCINQYGTKKQKEKYLPKLSTGGDYVAFCVNEDTSGSDLSLIKTRATLSDDRSFYELTGEKSWVINASNAKSFIVFAKTKGNVGQELQETMSAFLVEGPDDSIEFSSPYDTLSLPSLPVHNVKFKGTKVPTSNVIGGRGNGYQMAVEILHGDLYLKGGLWCRILKNLSKQLADHCIARKRFGKSLKDFGLIQEKLAELSMTIYSIESLSYMIAGVVDSYEYPDVLCESAALKIYASENLWTCLKEAMQIMGSTACKMDSNLPELLMNATANSLTHSTNEILRLYVALSCLQHAGIKLEDSIRKKRDSFNNVGYLLKEGWTQLKQSRQSSSLKLYDHVHPELSVCGEMLEPHIHRLKDLVVKYWTTKFINLQESQFALRKFADVAVNICIINSVLSRASRSKAIGLRHCDMEIILARTIYGKLSLKIEKDMDALELGELGNGDSECMKIAKSFIENDGYCIEHPLTRNW